MQHLPSFWKNFSYLWFYLHLFRNGCSFVTCFSGSTLLLSMFSSFLKNDLSLVYCCPFSFFTVIVECCTWMTSNILPKYVESCFRNLWLSNINTLSPFIKSMCIAFHLWLVYSSTFLYFSPCHFRFSWPRFDITFLLMDGKNVLIHG